MQIKKVENLDLLSSLKFAGRPPRLSLEPTREKKMKNLTSNCMAIAASQHLLKICKIKFESNSPLQRNIIL